MENVSPLADCKTLAESLYIGAWLNASFVRYDKLE